jgi:rhodanese-related sulfurtransferase
MPNLLKQLALAPVHLAPLSTPPPMIEPAALWQALRSEAPPLVIDVREPRPSRVVRPAASSSRCLTCWPIPTSAPRDGAVVLVCRGGSAAAAALLAAGHPTSLP